MSDDYSIQSDTRSTSIKQRRSVAENGNPSTGSFMPPLVPSSSMLADHGSDEYSMEYNDNNKFRSSSLDNNSDDSAYGMYEQDLPPPTPSPLHHHQQHQHQNHYYPETPLPQTSILHSSQSLHSYQLHQQSPRRRKYSEDSQSLPSWNAQPNSSYDDDNMTHYSHNNNNNGEGENWNNRFLVFTARRTRQSTVSIIMVLGFCIIGLSLYSSAQSTLQIAMKETHELGVLKDELNHQMQSAIMDVRLLERELAALDALERQREDSEVEQHILEQAAEFANPKVLEEMTILQETLKSTTQHAELLKHQVASISHKDALAKYGPKPKRVEMELVFPPGQEGPTTFIIEMAPLDVMPHSVFTFLEMCQIGIFSGWSFIMNALHVIKAAPLPYDPSIPVGLARQVKEKKEEYAHHMEHGVAFREYSPEFPHVSYTMGFTADGSPSFYINTEDNTELHKGDPCFAKVVSGLDTIQRLEKTPTKNGIWFQYRIGIKRVTILDD